MPEKTQESWLTRGSTDTKEVSEYYDTWAKDYDKNLEQWDYQAPEHAAELMKKHVPLTHHVFDAGCGTGLTGKALNKAGYSRLTGLDLSCDCLKVAKELNIYECLLAHDMHRVFPFSENHFDALLCIGVMAYIDDAQFLLKEFCRLVRPDGYIVFSQRHDLFESRGFKDIIASMENEGLWKNISISEPQAYLPLNEDFADKLLVIYCVCKVM